MWMQKGDARSAESFSEFARHRQANRTPIVLDCEEIRIAPSDGAGELNECQAGP
jgi:hypothetical protein